MIKNYTFSCISYGFELDHLITIVTSLQKIERLAVKIYTLSKSIQRFLCILRCNYPMDHGPWTRIQIVPYNQRLWWRQDRRTYRMVWIYLDKRYRTNMVLAFERATSEDDTEPIIPRKTYFMSTVLYFISSLNFVAL